jgi:hypothetical membrane protein
MRIVEPVTMSHEDTRAMDFLRSPGLWLLVGGLELLFLVHLSEFLYPGYSVSANYISDLGVGPMPSSIIFTVAVILFGLMALLAAALFRQKDKKSLIWLLVALTGIGAVGVGAVNMDYIPLVHRGSALAAFLFGNLAVLYSFKMVRHPLSYVFALLGLIGLSALALFGAGIYLGLGVGGMERMILYPAMFWAVGFGAYLSAEENRASGR